MLKKYKAHLTALRNDCKIPSYLSSSLVRCEDLQHYCRYGITCLNSSMMYQFWAEAEILHWFSSWELVVSTSYFTWQKCEQVGQPPESNSNFMCILVQKDFRLKKLSGPKNFSSKKMLGPKKSVCTKMILVPKNICVKKIVGPKIVVWKKVWLFFPGWDKIWNFLGT